MEMTVKIIVLFLLFMLGFSFGQGHGMFDLNGDRTISRADIRYISENILHIK